MNYVNGWKLKLKIELYIVYLPNFFNDLCTKTTLKYESTFYSLLFIRLYRILIENPDDDLFIS